MRAPLPFTLALPALLSFACQSDPAGTEDAGPSAVDAAVGADAPGPFPDAASGDAASGDAAHGDATTSPPDASACPADLFAAVGTPCAPDGAFCGGEACDPCSFCHIIHCTGGQWEDLEAPPPPPDDPACRPDAGVGCCHADADCGAGRHCSGGVCWDGPVPGGPCGCAVDADCAPGAACFDTDVACGVCLPAEQACRE